MALLEQFENQQDLVNTLPLTGFEEDGYYEPDLISNLQNDINHQIPLKENADSNYLGGVNRGFGTEVGDRDTDAIDGYADFTNEEETAIRETDAPLEDVSSDEDTTTVANELLDSD